MWTIILRDKHGCTMIIYHNSTWVMNLYANGKREPGESIGIIWEGENENDC